MLDETTYYFTAFAIDQNNDIIDSQTLSITTDFWWHVTPNTLLYIPMNTDLLDHGNNNISISDNSWVVIQNWRWYFNWSSRLLINNFNTYLNSLPFTISIWVNSQNWNNVWIFTSSNVYSWWYRWWNFWKMGSNESNKIRLECLPSWNIRTSSWITDNTRTLYWFSIQNWSAKIYKNWVVEATLTSFNLQFVANLRIWNQRFASQYWEENFFKWFMAEYIVENKARSDAERLDYYNKTKKKFWY